ncbi:ABC transporter permease [bacterium]|nr:ABC transporter permease [bacterium]
MKTIWIIFKREIGQFFSSAITYIMLAIFLAITGFLFYNIASYFALQCSQALQYKTAYNVPLPPMSANRWVILPFFSNIAIIALFLIPVLTMRSYSTERSSGTAELLLTSPIRTTQIVWAKLLSNFAIYIILIATTIIFQLILNYYTKPGIDWGPVWSGYLGLICLGIATIPLGQFISSLMKNQIIAVFISFALLLFLWIVDWSTLFSSGTISSLLGYIGLSKHFANFAKGVINTSDIIYFISLATIGIFLTHRSVESWRWRGI